MSCERRTVDPESGALGLRDLEFAVGFAEEPATLLVLTDHR